MTLAYFDCFSGAAGDMIAAALIDAGLAIGDLRADLALLGLAGFEVSAEKVVKQGFAATRFDVRVAESGHPHRHLRDIRGIITASHLPDEVKATASAIFERLAEAEAVAHGVDIEKVHFHEVGAVDAIVDVVSAVCGLRRLGVTEVRCSPIPPGSRTVTCAHGVIPVPAPGTAHLLKGVPLAACDEPGELTTPTGAAILTTLARSFGPMPAMTVRSVGYGAGTREGVTRPNVLRVFLGDADAAGDRDAVVVLETAIDDSTPEILGHAVERLMHAGALDAYCLPIAMKKGRPAVLLTVVCDPASADALEAIVFEETTTFGVRRTQASRAKLTRSFQTVETPFGPIRVKVGRRGDRVVTASPEFADCQAAAERSGVAVRVVMDAAAAAFRPPGQ